MLLTQSARSSGIDEIIMMPQVCSNSRVFWHIITLAKNLEESMQRMVSLVSLYLEDTTDGELDKAGSY